jgi:hypothetical protein
MTINSTNKHVNLKRLTNKNEHQCARKFEAKLNSINFMLTSRHVNTFKIGFLTMGSII